MSPIPSSPGHGLLNKMTVQSGSAFFRIEFLPVFKVRQNSQIFMNVTTFQISFPRLLEATWRSKSVVVMETSFICTPPFISLQTNGPFTLPRSVVATSLGFSVEAAALVVAICTMLVYYWGQDLHNPGPCYLCSSFYAFGVLQRTGCAWAPVCTWELCTLGSCLSCTTVLQMFLHYRSLSASDFSLKQAQLQQWLMHSACSG